jgi:capsular exopolysaccharide synthesis family protein
VTSIAKRDNPETAPSRAPIHLDLRSHADDDLALVRRLLNRLRKKWVQVAIVFVVVFVPATIATFLATPLYRSTALVQVNSDPAQVVPYRDVADTGSGGANFDNYMGTQERLLMGSGLMGRVAKRLATDMKNSPAAGERQFLGERFNVKKIEKSQLFELAYRAETPQAAAIVVNLFAEEFAKQNFEMRQATRVKAEQQLGDELAGLEKRLQASETELVAYAESHNMMSVEQGQVDPLQQRLTILTQQLADAEGQSAQARATYDSTSRITVDTMPQRLMSQEIGQVQTRLLQAEQELTTLRVTYGPNWPGVVEKRNEVTLLRDQLAREKAAIVGRSQEQARLDVQGAEARRQMAVTALAEQKELVNKFHDASVRYSMLKREVDTNRTLYDGLLARLRQTGLLAGLEFGNIHIVEPGRPRGVADSPKVLLNLGAAALLGLALGVCLVLLSNWLDDSITTLDEAEQLSPLPTLGSVPLMKTENPRALITASTNVGSSTQFLAPVDKDKPDGAAAGQMPFEVTESVRSICASLLLSRSDSRPKVIVVTSAAPAEGKTTLSVHLGRAFAETGTKTLLVEADMRKQDLSRTFDLTGEDGLSLYLAGLVPGGPRIHKTEINNLFVAPGGPTPPNPAALLHSERLAQFLKAAAAEFQVVIVDTPPVLSIADARIMGIKADGVVLVVRAGKTSKALVRRAWVLLESTGSNVLGMVLNGWEPNKTELAHYRYYQSFSGNDKAKSA